MLAYRWFRGAAAWAAAVAATLAAILGLKLLFLSCARCWPDAGLESPSGHTAAAAAIYGGLLTIALRRFAGRARWSAPILLLLAPLLVATIMGASRLLLQVHSWPEIVVGSLVGLAGAIAFAAAAGPPPTRPMDRRLLVPIAAVLLLCHGLHMPAEAAIRQAAWSIGLLCPC